VKGLDVRLAKTLAVLGACFVLAGSRVAGQDRALSLILVKAGAYADAFERQFTGIVAEESYAQDAGGVHRDLKSDLLLIRASDDRYVEFRDVFQVDGRAVRDRDDRLTRLFLDPSASAQAQLQAIVTESARYNIGNIQRTINTPTLALTFLLTRNQHGSVFEIRKSATPELGRRGPFGVVPAGTIVLSFDEGKRDTVIRTSRGRDLPSHGHFWIDPATGDVLMTELIAEDAAVRGVIDVRYEQDPSLGVLVPSVMRERYDGNRIAGITGTATYGRFRKFQVSTDTDINTKGAR
jgi:hypothetical protein